MAQGFAVEILGAPNNASLNGKRQTEAYADTIGRAVAFARTRASAPVWLVGTSAGTTGAANGAARLTGRVAGLALTSSVTRQNSGGETVFDTNLAAIMEEAQRLLDARRPGASGVPIAGLASAQ